MDEANYRVLVVVDCWGTFTAFPIPNNSSSLSAVAGRRSSRLFERDVARRHRGGTVINVNVARRKGAGDIIDRRM
jgi:hypothetical protein